MIRKPRILGAAFGACCTTAGISAADTAEAGATDDDVSSYTPNIAKRQMVNVKYCGGGCDSCHRDKYPARRVAA